MPLTRHPPDRNELAIYPRKADDLHTRPERGGLDSKGCQRWRRESRASGTTRQASQLTDAQLKDLASKHLTYEVVHLVTALTRVVRMKARGDHASPTHNLCVEGVLLDARALADSPRSTRTNPDDLLATNYLSTWERLATPHGDLHDRINRQVPHLTTTRLDKQGFDLAGIAGDVLCGVIKFVEQVAAERREWFAQAEQLPGRRSPSSLQRRRAARGLARRTRRRSRSTGLRLTCRRRVGDLQSDSIARRRTYLHLPRRECWCSSVW